MRNEDLLKPTLSEYGRAPALYHSTGFALSAFFGGPVGAAIYALANTMRLGQLARDGTMIVILAGLACLVPFELARQGGLQPLADYLGVSPRRAAELLLRALGLACLGAIYLRQRKYFRAASISGVKPLSGWVPGVAAVVLGLLANWQLLNRVLAHH